MERIEEIVISCTACKCGQTIGRNNLNGEGHATLNRIYCSNCGTHRVFVVVPNSEQVVASGN